MNKTLIINFSFSTSLSLDVATVAKCLIMPAYPALCSLLRVFCKGYPIPIYSKGMQLLLTFVVSYALTGYYPVANLLGKNLPHLCISHISPIIALVIAICMTAYMGCDIWHALYRPAPIHQ